jgi:hypothetical protein
MQILLRILVLVPLGFVAALLAGCAVLLAAEGSGPIDSFFWVFALWFAMHAGAYVAVPSFVAIVFAELFGWRSLVFWALLGGVIGAAPVLFGPWIAGMADPRLAAFATAGVIGGAVYWLIAGRSSGLAEAERAA